MFANNRKAVDLMKKLFLIVVYCAAALFLTEAQAAAVDGIVVKYPLNVRAGAGTRYNVVGQLTKNNPVRILAANQHWLMIAAPANCRVWVLQRYIKNNRFIANVNLRSGPGTGFERVGTGTKGSSVKIGGKATASGWVPIVPPRDVVFYVGRPAVEADAKQLAKLPKCTVAGVPLPNLQLCALEYNFTEPTKTVTVGGYIYKEGTSPVTHVLYEATKENLQPKYFLMPQGKKFTFTDGAHVQLTGEHCKVKGWEMPLIIVKSIKNLK